MRKYVQAQFCKQNLFLCLLFSLSPPSHLFAHLIFLLFDSQTINLTLVPQHFCKCLLQSQSPLVFVCNCSYYVFYCCVNFIQSIDCVNFSSFFPPMIYKIVKFNILNANNFIAFVIVRFHIIFLWLKLKASFCVWEYLNPGNAYLFFLFCPLGSKLP